MPLGPDTADAVLAQLSEAVSIPDRSGVIARLEDALQEYFGARYAVLTSSGTAALHSMFTALGLRSGEEVIAPAYTFFATVTPLLHMGVRPVLVDSDETGNVNPAAVERAITSRTKAVVVTHLWGVPCDMRGLIEITARHGLALLEDGSHAHGATIAEDKVGTLGTASAFSLNGPKPLSAGEGGFAMTDDEEVYYRLLLHGHYNKRCRTEIPVENPLAVYAVTGMGLKLRIHPLAAAIALNQLSRLDTYLVGRRRIAARMLQGLRGLPGLTVPDVPAHVEPAWYALCLQYHSEELDGLPIREFTAALHAEGCAELDRPGSTCPLNLHPLFQDDAPPFPGPTEWPRYAPGDFPVAERVHRQTLKLPVWHRSEDVPLADAYVTAFSKVIGNHQDLLRRGRTG